MTQKGALNKAQQIRAEATAARAKIAEAEAETLSKPYPEVRMFDGKVVLEHGNGVGHNCPHKDSSTTHPVKTACFKKHHVGVCMVCGHLASYVEGCDHECSIQKGEALEINCVLASQIPKDDPVYQQPKPRKAATPQSNTVEKAMTKAKAEGRKRGGKR